MIVTVVSLSTLFLLCCLASMTRLFALASARSVASSLASTGSSSGGAAVTLITFDVDGTLIAGSSRRAEYSVHARAFGHGVGKAFLEGKGIEDKYPSPLLRVPPHRYHGATDGLIALNFAHSFGVSVEEAVPKLQDCFRYMAEYYSARSDEEAIEGVEALPGVVETLTRLARISKESNGQLMVGLVTGNVEAIARKKMRATKILATEVFTKAAADQVFPGELDSTFLGGFGSDYCSGDIHDETRLYKDRGEQIALAVRRAQTLLRPDQRIVRVVHVGDAPTDVLAAKWCEEQVKFGEEVTVSCIAVATGKYSSKELSQLVGDFQKGRWEPVILDNGIADPSFIDHATGKIEYK